MLGKGTATAITKADIAAAADSLGAHPATLDAISQAESHGFGWFPDGRIKILPEPHKFHLALPKHKRVHALNMGLSTKSYRQTKSSGHYGRMSRDGSAQYVLLEKWIKYDEAAAYEAISIGRYQIMGFHWKMLGFASAKDMFDQFCESEEIQLQALVTFLRKKKLVKAVRTSNFDRIEHVYNGGGQNGAYAEKMARYEAKFRAGKWKGYKPGSYGKPAPVPTLRPVPPAITDAEIQKRLEDNLRDEQLVEPPKTGDKQALVAVGFFGAVSAGAVWFWEQIETFFKGLF